MQDCVKEVRDLESSYEDINALIELTEEEEDREMIKEIQREIAKFEKPLPHRYAEKKPHVKR